MAILSSAVKVFINNKELEQVFNLEVNKDTVNIKSYFDSVQEIKELKDNSVIKVVCNDEELLYLLKDNKAVFDAGEIAYAEIQGEEIIK